MFLAQPIRASSSRSSKPAEGTGRGKVLRKPRFIPAGVSPETVISQEPSVTKAVPGQDLVLVGKILKEHGLTGNLVVQLFTENPDRFQPGAIFSTDQKNGPEKLVVADVAERGEQDTILVTFEGVATREEAADLVGTKLFISFEDRALPDKGHYYPDEMIGMKVLDRDGTVEGEVLYLDYETPAPYLQVKTVKFGELAIPFRKEFITSINRVKREIRLREPLEFHNPVE